MRRVRRLSGPILQPRPESAPAMDAAGVRDVRACRRVRLHPQPRRCRHNGGGRARLGDRHRERELRAPYYDQHIHAPDRPVVQAARAAVRVAADVRGVVHVCELLSLRR